MKAPRLRSAIELANLVVAPALMSIGDLMHPPESMDATAQVGIIVAASTRWFLAHLLLFAGMLLFIPGFLLLTRTVARRRPALGYASRVLVLASVGALAAVFAFEMLQGSVASRLDQSASISMLETFNSRVLVVLLPALLSFFVA